MLRSAEAGFFEDFFINFVYSHGRQLAFLFGEAFFVLNACGLASWSSVLSVRDHDSVYSRMSEKCHDYVINHIQHISVWEAWICFILFLFWSFWYKELFSITLRLHSSYLKAKYLHLWYCNYCVVCFFFMKTDLGDLQISQIFLYVHCNNRLFSRQGNRITRNKCHLNYTQFFKHYIVPICSYSN